MDELRTVQLVEQLSATVEKLSATVAQVSAAAAFLAIALLAVTGAFLYFQIHTNRRLKQLEQRFARKDGEP